MRIKQDCDQDLSTDFLPLFGSDLFFFAENLGVGRGKKQKKLDEKLITKAVNMKAALYENSICCHSSNFGASKSITKLSLL